MQSDPKPLAKSLVPPDASAAGARRHLSPTGGGGQQSKLHEPADRQHLAELNNIYRSAPIGLCVLDPELRYLRINDLMAAANGRSAADHIGRTLREVVPDLADQIESVLQTVIKSRMPVLEHEVRGTTSAVPGVPRFWLQSYLPIIDESFVLTGINVTSIDITDRKRAEEDRQALLEAERAARAEAERVNRMKDEFLATVSHELRTPLNAIVGWTRLLARGGAGDAPHALDIIDRNASSLTQIVEDLLDTSRIISGKIRLKRQTVDVAQLVRATLEGVQPAAEAKYINLVTSFDPGMLTLSCDPTRIQQIVWNLLTNAIKFTSRDGEVLVAVTRRPRSIQITVRDNGEGIAQEFMPNLFTRFYQADTSTTRRHGGLGLGLAITRHLVELHGGTIHAESPGPGQGATFRVELPAGDHHPAPVSTGIDEAVHEDLKALPEVLAGLRIVLVDDDADACQLVARILEEDGAQVRQTLSAAEGFDAALATRPDLLISDISMPGEDGYSFIRRIRAAGPWGRQLRCLAITALARPEDRTKALEAGYDAHVAKPFDSAQLVSAIVRLVGGPGARRAQAPADLLRSEPLAHVLVAEDSEPVAEMIKLLLETSGYRVRIASTVAEAVAAAEDSTIDFVISDMGLPDGTGCDLMERVRQQRPIQGIVLSGYSDEDSRQRSRRAGFAEYLVKPVDDRELLAALARLNSRTAVVSE